MHVRPAFRTVIGSVEEPRATGDLCALMRADAASIQHAATLMNKPIVRGAAAIFLLARDLR